MNKKQHRLFFKSLLWGIMCCIHIQCNKTEKITVEVYETSERGNALTLIKEFKPAKKTISIQVNPNHKFQTIIGFGGSFTEASAYLLNNISAANRKKILDAYFSENGANYSLTRTHIA